MLAFFLAVVGGLQCVTRERRLIEQQFVRSRAAREALRASGSREMVLGLSIAEQVARASHASLSAHASALCVALGTDYEDPCVSAAYDARTDECVVVTEQTPECKRERWRATLFDNTRRFRRVEARIPLCE